MGAAVDVRLTGAQRPGRSSREDAVLPSAPGGLSGGGAGAAHPARLRQPIAGVDDVVAGRDPELGAGVLEVGADGVTDGAARRGDPNSV